MHLDNIFLRDIPTEMIDKFTIFSRGGAVLWSHTVTSVSIKFVKTTQKCSHFVPLCILQMDVLLTWLYLDVHGYPNMLS